MSDIEDYQERLDDLLADAVGEEIDPMYLLLSAALAYLEEELRDEDDQTMAVDFGGVTVVISLQPSEEARLH
ncbi:hypothetical protein [Cronobacter dublinensis]|uniref:hypothetical protein n=1 Tax=Cronobacter dublinensis TaxID=413497 RepID=UPI0005765DA9|nr:hypothetical protein [Cronobacter dublinensis]